MPNTLAQILNPFTETVFSRSAVSSTPASAMNVTEMLVDTSAIAITIEAPSPPQAGFVFAVTDQTGNASAHNITVDGNGHTIEGNSTFTISADDESAVFVWDASANEWRSAVYARQIVESAITFADDVVGEAGGGGGGGGAPGGDVRSVQYKVDAATFGGALEAHVTEDFTNLALGDAAADYPDSGLLRLAYPGADFTNVISIFDDGGVVRTLLAVGTGDQWQFGDPSRILDGTVYAGTYTVNVTTEHVFVGSGGWGLFRASDSLVYLQTINADGSIQSAAAYFETTTDTNAALNNTSPLSLQTTDSTPTTIDTVDVPTDTSLTITWWFEATKDDASQAGGFILTVTYRNTGGTLFQVGSDTLGYTNTDDAAWTVFSAISGTSVIARVQGKAATTIRWSFARTFLRTAK